MLFIEYKTPPITLSIRTHHALPDWKTCGIGVQSVGRTWWGRILTALVLLW